MRAALLSVLQDPDVSKALAGLQPGQRRELEEILRRGLPARPLDGLEAHLNVSKPDLDGADLGNARFGAFIAGGATSVARIFAHSGE